MAIITWSYGIASYSPGMQAGLGTDKDVLHVKLSSRTSAVASTEASGEERVSVVSILPVVIIFSILILALIISAIIATLSRRPKPGHQETEAKTSRKSHTSLEENPRMSSHTGCDCDQTLKLLGFAVHHDGCSGQEKFPHSRASSSILVAHDDSPGGTYLRPAPAAHSAVVPDPQVAELSKWSETPPGLEGYPFSRRPTMRSTHTATHEAISKPLPALLKSSTASSPKFPLPFDSAAPDDVSSFTYARFQATMRSTRSRTTSDFPREPKLRSLPKLRKRTSASW